MSAKITAYCITVHIIIDGKVIKTEGLHKSQLRAQAVRLFEEDYSYCVIAKKLGSCKVWTGKWARHLKMTPAKSLQSQSWRGLANKTALNLTI